MSKLSDWIQHISDDKQPPYPIVDFPIVTRGLIIGPIRYESLDGSEMYMGTPDQVNKLSNAQPFSMGGKTWAISNLQKKSSHGWIKTDPDGFYWWRTYKFQEPGKPGTEFGPYFRKPWSWRWDVPGTLIDGQLRHFVWTKGYFGFHYD